MATSREAHVPEVLDLRHLPIDELSPVLEEEIRTWQQRLDWDFRPSADLVRRFVAMQALNGYALLVAGRPVGYSYYVSEERKGLIGDLYVLQQFRTIENENRLLAAVLETLMHTPSVRRIESQLMMLRSARQRPLPASGFLKIFDRDFLTADLDRAGELAPGAAEHKVLIEHWSERRHEEAARLIAEAYRGHIDSQINDQYHSVAGARRFLFNIIQYPGCGAFFPPASYVALEAVTGRFCGLSLSSLVAANIGHITQICVAPSVKGTGVGYELLRHSLRSLAEHGCRKAGLTVTSVNLEALRLYERLGFLTIYTFAAYVWEGF